MTIKMTATEAKAKILSLLDDVEWFDLPDPWTATP